MNNQEKKNATTLKSRIDSILGSVTDGMNLINESIVNKGGNSVENLSFSNLSENINTIPSSSIEDAPSDGKTYGRKNKQWSEIIASGQYLDFDNLFTDTNGTLADEQYNKIVEAYNNSINVAKTSGGFVSFTFADIPDSYEIGYTINIIGTNNILAILTASISIDKTSKNYTGNSFNMEFQKYGTGTKFLSDDGSYKEIKSNGGVLPQETKNNILDAINKIDYANPSKTTVTPEEYNSIITAFDGKITPDEDTIWNISYDNVNPLKFMGTKLVIFSSYLIFHKDRSIRVTSYYTSYNFYYSTFGNASAGDVSMIIGGESDNYKLTYTSKDGIPVIGTNGIYEITELTQSAYDKLTEKKYTTLYIITD